jgi:hypothetical protein
MKDGKCRVWWCTSVIPVLRSGGRKIQCEASLGYTVRPSLKKKNKGWGCSSVWEPLPSVTRPWVWSPALKRKKDGNWFFLSCAFYIDRFLIGFWWSTVHRDFFLYIIIIKSKMLWVILFDWCPSLDRKVHGVYYFRLLLEIWFMSILSILKSSPWGFMITFKIAQNCVCFTNLCFLSSLFPHRHFSQDGFHIC